MNRKIGLFLLLLFVGMNISFIYENDNYKLLEDVEYRNVTISNYQGDCYRGHMVKQVQRVVKMLPTEEGIPLLAVCLLLQFVRSAFTPIKLSRHARLRVRSPSNIHLPPY